MGKEMVDPISTVEKIVKIALAISKAVDKAQRNIDECKDIQIQVATASGALKILKKKGLIDKVPELSGAMGHLKKTLEDALEDVKACKAEQNIVQHLLKAEKLSNQLGKVKQDITQSAMMVNLLINAYMASNPDHRNPKTKPHKHQRVNVPTDKKVKLQINKKVKKPTNNKENTTPTDKKVKKRTDKKDKKPTDKKDTKPTDKKDTKPTDKKDKTPGEHRKKMPTDQKAKTPREHGRPKTPTN